MRMVLTPPPNLARILAQLLFVLFLLTLVASQGVSAQTTCSSDDIDRDDDGLIEICDLEGLNAIRHQPDGTGYKASADATIVTTGCRSGGCDGYELTRSLDFNNNANYRTIANKTTWTTGNGWLPIGTFSAKFNGNGHAIANLMINRSSAGNAGLFGNTSGAITNLGVLNVNIIGFSSVGGLAGSNSGTITNSYATGTVEGSSINGNVGGLVGWNNSSGTIENSYATGKVSGTNPNVGGLVGSNFSATIENSYATGTVEGSDSSNNVGGLAGLNTLNATIRYSYATGKVSGSGSDVGGLVGRNNTSIPASTINNSYWLSGSASSGGTNVAANTEKTAIELTSPTAPGTNSGDIYHNWSTNDWDFGTSDQFPILKASDSDALLPGQGIGLRNLQSSTAGAELRPTFSDAITLYTITPPSTNRIDLTLTAYHPSATITLVREGELTNYRVVFAGSGSASVPIATNSVLIIMVSEPNLSPIFYQVLLTTMPPCTFSIPDDDGDGVGRAMDIDKDGDGLIEICDLEGLNEVRHQLDGTGYTTSTGVMKITTGCPSAGCSGYELTRSLDFMDNDSYRILSNKPTWTTGNGWEPIGDSNRFFNAIFDGNGHTISNLIISRRGTTHIGLFGRTGTSAEIANLGLLDLNTTGQTSVGGLVGGNEGRITNSYATGTVSGTGDRFIGGLVGGSSGMITNSYATGSVVGTASTSAIGGLVGFHSGTITNSYVMARSVSGSGFSIGGLAGNNTGIVANSYVTARSVSGSGSSVGGLIGNNTGRINNSYWQGSASRGGTNVAADTRKTIQELTSPIDPGTMPTDVYYDWNTDDWDFGNSNQYPALKYAKDTDTNYQACSDTLPQTGSDQPQCKTLLPYQGINIGDSSLRESLRELKISRVITSFEPSFGVSTNNYVVTIFLPAGITEYDIVLRLRAYNSDAEIQIFKAGDSTDYFENKRSGQSSSRITVGEGTKLTIRVSKPNTDYTLTFAVDVGELPIRVRTKVFLEGPLQ